MKVQCPTCNTTYRLTKVPSAKVAETCKKCWHMFNVEPPNVQKEIQQPKVKPQKALQQIKSQKSSEGDRPHDRSTWHGRKRLVWVSLLVLWPVGLYGLWKSSQFSSKFKAVVTALREKRGVRVPRRSQVKKINFI